MNLWTVTLTFPTGRRQSHYMYAVIASNAAEAKAKAVAYVNPDPDATWSVDAEIDPDGVIQGGVYHTKTPKAI